VRPDVQGGYRSRSWGIEATRGDCIPETPSFSYDLQFDITKCGDGAEDRAIVVGQMLSACSEPYGKSIIGGFPQVLVPSGTRFRFLVQLFPGVRLAGECLSKGGTQRRSSRRAGRPANRLS
jgi:hypothetical protein